MSSEEAEDKSNDILIPDESEYMESDLDSCKVPVIEIPYWKVGKDHGQITLYNWEFGVGDAKKWPFDETHYNRWEACQPWGFSKCCKCQWQFWNPNYIRDRLNVLSIPSNLAFASVQRL